MPQFHEEKADSAVVVPKDNGNYSVETENGLWNTVDFISIERQGVNITEPVRFFSVTMKVNSSRANGIITHLSFNEEPLIMPHEEEQ